MKVSSTEYAPATPIAKRFTQKLMLGTLGSGWLRRMPLWLQLNSFSDVLRKLRIALLRRVLPSLNADVRTFRGAAIDSNGRHVQRFREPHGCACPCPFGQ